MSSNQINPNLVPSISAGNLFRRLTEDTTLNIRWLYPTDPVYYATLNRPSYDITLRQLIMAKAIDGLELQLSHLSLFPFLIPPKAVIGTTEYDLPEAWVWDMHESMPSKWQYVRLMKIMRISGDNGTTGTDTPTGSLRFVYSGQLVGSSTEVALFYADYRIDSNLTYQYVTTSVCTDYEYPTHIDSSEASTVAGYMVFRTLDLSDTTNLDFIRLLEPPTDTTDSNSDGIYDNPTSYYLADSQAGGSADDDYMIPALPHGTGILVLSAFNLVPPSDSDFNLWLSSNNYPFRLDSSRTSTDGIIIPKALFREFNIVAPSADEPTGDVTKLNSPVWVSSIERVDTLAAELKFVFSTYSTPVSGVPTIIEFATMTLNRTHLAGRIVKIEPLTDLFEESDTSFQQGFGTGYVVLSSLWGASTGEVDDFFDSFLALVSVPPETIFAKASAILSSYSVARVPKYTPTVGQSEAARGTGSGFDTPKNPSSTNRFVVEQDTGLGDEIDFSAIGGFTENADIDNKGYKATSVRKLIKLVVDSNGDNHDYTTDILPRLTLLLGRAPVFGDMWFDGTYFKVYSGDAWITI